MKLPNNTSTTKEIEKEDKVELYFSEDVDKVHTNYIDFENPKAVRKYIKSIESMVRCSDEYKNIIKYLKEEQDYSSCSFFNEIDIKEIKNVGIEFHHYPFTLYDIVEIILKKESDFYSHQINSFDIANETMRIHYEGLVGLVPLSKTLHELAHSGNIFINFKLVSGNVKEFMRLYNAFIDDSLLENIKVLNMLSDKNSEQSNKFILHKTFQNIIMENREIKEIVKSKNEQKLA